MKCEMKILIKIEENKNKNKNIKMCNKVKIKNVLENVP